MSPQYEYLQEALSFVGGSIDIDGTGRQLLSLNGSVHPVEVLTAGVIFPRDAKTMAWSALEARNSGMTPIIAAEVVSEGARDFLRSHRIGYCDAGGSLCLPFDGSFVLVDRPARKQEKRVVKSVLSGRTSLAVHALMSAKEPMKGVDIAAMTGLSLGGVSAALDKLDRMGWLSTEGSGPRKLRRLADHRGFLEHWKAVRMADGPVAKEKLYVPGCSDPEAVARKVASVASEIGISYMISGPYGSQLHAPWLTSTPQVTCRVSKSDIVRLAEAMGARKAPQGWNLGLIVSEIPVSSPFAVDFDGLVVGSPLVCWVDTVAEGGRSPELADHLLAERLL